jgi:hypothetical protein
MEPTVPDTLPAASGWSALPRRMLRAALLDADLYEEVEADRSATAQAFLVVVLAAVAAGVGAIDNHGALGVVWHTIARVLLWGIWAWVTCVIGTRLLPDTETRSDWGELLRTIGFSSAPGVLHVFGLFEPITPWVFTVCGLWTGIAMVVAVRQALDYTSTWRAIAVCAIGFPVYALGTMGSILLLGPWPV